MPNKNLVQDVIPPKKSIRNVKLPERGATVSPVKKSGPKITREIPKPEPVDEPIVVQDFSRPVSIKSDIQDVNSENTFNNTRPPFNNVNSYKYEFDEPKKPSKKVLYIGIVVFLVLGYFLVSSFFKSSQVKITPKNQIVSLNESFTAKKDISSGGLGFQTVSVTKDIEKTVEASGESRVDKKARGMVIIYNNYSSQPQKLVATTRLETPEGLVFRIINAVTVPGNTVKSGKTVAGSVEAIVEADKPGSDYNVGFKDFTIPGLKGDPKYTKIYARSKTEMTGGFSGMQKTVSENVILSVDKDMEKSLRDSMLNDISSQIPADFVLYTPSMTFSFEPISQMNSTSGGAVLKKKGTATAVIFDKGVLSRVLMAKLLPDSVNDVVKVTNLEELDFSYASGTSNSVNTANSITFSLRGEPQFVWVLDENKIKSELLGLSKNNAKSVLTKYPMVKEAWIETRPFWNQTIPSDSKDVTIVNTLTK